MSERTVFRTHPAHPGVRPRIFEVQNMEPAYQAYSLLYYGFVALPIIAGIDKFTHMLVDWNQYLAPVVTRLLNVTPDFFMRGVGVIEIVAGLLVAVKPRIGAAVVGLWILGIIGNLLLVPGYLDIALRDFGLVLGAFSLWRLSAQFNR